ncbi:MAG: LamG domain-containing protein, partial [Loktanella sp.]|nr:LamG domain-containing protein [Loktanella sp.]
SVEPLDHDRSVNINGLIVSGTITRSPVAEGAELVAYSGFNTTAKYLSQQYNADLDFGAGDFSVMVWLDQMEAWRSVVSRGLPDAVSFIIEGNGTQNTVRINIGGSVFTKSLPWFNGVWKHLAFVRHSGVVSLYLDGVETDSWAAPGTVSVADAPLFIGKNTIFGSGSYPGKMALLRISASAPTPDQVAKIYEDERKLFQPGAQCTLYGTSDEITALAHDPKTNLLHVGTGDGRSVFDGLLRVANTETPVTTAISAAGGMIAEQ